MPPCCLVPAWLFLLQSLAVGERGPGAECRALGGKQEKKKKKRSVPGNWFYPTRRRKGGGIFVWDAVVHGFFPHLVFGTVVDMGQPGVPSSPWVFATCRYPQVSLDGSVKCRSINDRHGDKWERLQVHPGADVY